MLWGLVYSTKHAKCVCKNVAFLIVAIWALLFINLYNRSLYVCGVCRCVGGCGVCPAMRFVMLRGMGWNLAWVGDGPTRLKSIPHQRSYCLRNALSPPWPPNLVRRTPDWSVVLCWGQRSHRGHRGSTKGQNAQECPMANKFGRKNPWPKCSALIGSMQGSAGGNYGSNCLGMPYGYKFGRKNPRSTSNAFIGSKVMQESSGVNQRANAQKCLGPSNMINVALALEQKE